MGYLPCELIFISTMSACPLFVYIVSGVNVSKACAGMAGVGVKVRVTRGGGFAGVFVFMKIIDIKSVSKTRINLLDIDMISFDPFDFAQGKLYAQDDPSMHG